MEEFLGKEFDVDNNIHFIGDSNLQIILTKNVNIIVNLLFYCLLLKEMTLQLP